MTEHNENNIFTFDNQNQQIELVESVKQVNNSNQIMFTTIDPMGNKVNLMSYTFHYHIIGDHVDRKFLEEETNFNIIPKVIENPSVIMVDKDYDNRLVYIATPSMKFKEGKKITGLHIVTEQSSIQEYNIVTVRNQSRISQFEDGRVIYNVFNT
ncbi:Uncharacterised protein [Listeria grayi]|uniref:Uncharacterized protein n=1 Tax=Listeria grayi TaxID=1641 RepID=A0A378MJ08_LISGR|nr:hypothetical protein [Listeria grayi]STY45523.1 Uncharacterised protein [Listeria grayi]